MKMKTISLLALSAAGLSACATLEESAAELVAQTYDAELTGGQIVGAGDPDGFATFEVTVSDELGQVCYDLNDERNLGTVTAVMLHRGSAGTNGPMIANFDRNEQNGYQDCLDTPDWVQGFIEADPTGFYVMVHTADYPNGAVRGQLDRD